MRVYINNAVYNGLMISKRVSGRGCKRSPEQGRLPIYIYYIILRERRSKIPVRDRARAAGVAKKGYLLLNYGGTGHCLKSNLAPSRSF